MSVRGGQNKNSTKNTNEDDVDVCAST
jgi:hypothetical protein